MGRTEASHQLDYNQGVMETPTQKLLERLQLELAERDARIRKLTSQIARLKAQLVAAGLRPDTGPQTLAKPRKGRLIK